MNEVMMADKNLSMDRTPQLIAVEINSIKEQTRKILLFNSIEIGRKLTEAKTLIDHGEWGEWLEKYVDYSQRTASNLMRIFTDYGSSQITLFCDNAKSQALANLSYTQAVALLGIPQEEREAFIEEQDIDSMSTRELQQAIKERQELETKLKLAEENAKTHKEQAEAADQSLNDLTDSYTELQEALIKANQKAESDQQVTESVLRTTEAVVEKLQNDLQIEKEESKSEREAAQRVSDSYDKLEKTNHEHYQTSERLRKELAEAQVAGNTDLVQRLQEAFDEADSARNGALIMIQKLELQIKETPIEVTAAQVIEKVPEEVEKELNELRERTKELEAMGSQPINTATLRFKLHFDSLVKGFGDILRVLGEIDAEEHERYKGVVRKLIGEMSGKL